MHSPCRSLTNPLYVRPNPPVDFGVFRSSPNIQPATIHASDPRSGSRALLLVVGTWTGAALYRRGHTIPFSPNDLTRVCAVRRPEKICYEKESTATLQRSKLRCPLASLEIHHSSNVNKRSRCTNSREREPNEFDRIWRTKIFIFSVFYLRTPL